MLYVLPIAGLLGCNVVLFVLNVYSSQIKVHFKRHGRVLWDAPASSTYLWRDDDGQPQRSPSLPHTGHPCSLSLWAAMEYL
jgi:hypothetical protein